MAATRVLLHASCADAARHNTTWCAATANRRSLCNELAVGARGGPAAAAGVEESAPLLRGATWRREEVRFGSGTRGSPSVQQWRYFSVFDCPGPGPGLGPGPGANGSHAPPLRSRGAARGRGGRGGGGAAAEQAAHASQRVCMVHKDKAHETQVMGLSSLDGLPPPVHRS